MKQDLYLSLEQMRTLESLGVNITDASHYIHIPTNNVHTLLPDESLEKFEGGYKLISQLVGDTRPQWTGEVVYPTYILQEILNKLPSYQLWESKTKENKVGIITLHKQGANGQLMHKYANSSLKVSYNMLLEFLNDK